MHVLGTAGHVDHGKSSLLRVLTGMEPSRLAEERRRGMTMQLGYVWTLGPDGGTVGIIDVPGHADYRLAMLSGASALDAFLFVCAADDGWMPQSEEHLWALRALGVAHGVVALTKCDLVTPARLADLKAELEVRFFEALGREIRVVPFSATTRAGEVELRAALTDVLAALPRDVDRGLPEMYVDRVFTVAGQGTVVTGTLRHGALAEKQRVEILPGGKRATIRTLQCYGEPVAVARPNSRVALQLAGVGTEDVGRDAQIAVCGTGEATGAVDVRFAPFGGWRVDAKRTPRVLVVHGGVRTQATLIPVGDGHVRLSLATPRWLRFGDRVLVVGAGGDRVLGSGVVVDEQPAPGVRRAAEWLGLVRDVSLFEYLTVNVAKRGYVAPGAIARRTRFREAELAELLAGDEEAFLRLGDWLTDREHLRTWSERALALLAAQHEAHPEEEGLPESSLAKRLALPAELLRLVLKQLKQTEKIAQVGPYLKLRHHVPRVDAASQLARRLAEIAASPEPVAHTLLDLGVDDLPKRRLVARFVTDGKLVRLDEKHVMAAGAFAALAERVRGFLAAHGPATAAEVRDAIGLGRKLLIQVLEAMDTAKMTVREGERRRLVGAFGDQGALPPGPPSVGARASGGQGASPLDPRLLGPAVHQRGE